jgi:hypothetical protein
MLFTQYNPKMSSAHRGMPGWLKDKLTEDKKKKKKKGKGKERERAKKRKNRRSLPHPRKRTRVMLDESSSSAVPVIEQHPLEVVYRAWYSLNSEQHWPSLGYFRSLKAAEECNKRDQAVLLYNYLALAEKDNHNLRAFLDDKRADGLQADISDRDWQILIRRVLIHNPGSWRHVC